MATIYSLKNVVKERLVDGAGFRLQVPSVQIKAQEHIALVGHSGCGKSTLLDMLALVLHPDQADQFDLHPVEEQMYNVESLWQRKKQGALSQVRKQHTVTRIRWTAPYLTVRENGPCRLLSLPEDDSVQSLSRWLPSSTR